MGDTMLLLSRLAMLCLVTTQCMEAHGINGEPCDSNSDCNITFITTDQSVRTDAQSKNSSVGKHTNENGISDFHMDIHVLATPISSTSINVSWRSLVKDSDTYGIINGY